ncbi:MAG: hypothetical protein R2771_11190 [Saprospiraceae bacterium]
MTERDEEGISDYFTIEINPFDDAQQEFVFTVNAARVQIDYLNTLSDGTDYSCMLYGIVQ